MSLRSLMSEREIGAFCDAFLKLVPECRGERGEAKKDSCRCGTWPPCYTTVQSSLDFVAAHGDTVAKQAVAALAAQSARTGKGNPGKGGSSSTTRTRRAA